MTESSCCGYSYTGRPISSLSLLDGVGINDGGESGAVWGTGGSVTLPGEQSSADHKGENLVAVSQGNSCPSLEAPGSGIETHVSLGCDSLFPVRAVSPEDLDQPPFLACRHAPRNEHGVAFLSCLRGSKSRSDDKCLALGWHKVSWHKGPCAISKGSTGRTSTAL